MNRILLSAIRVSTGSAFGQVALIIALLVSTRYFEPEYLGALSLLSTITAVTAVLAGARLDLALPVAGGNDRYSQLALFFERLTNQLSIVGIVIVLGAFVFFHSREGGGGPVITVATLLVLGTAVTLRFDARTLMAIRERKFRYVGQAHACAGISQGLFLILAGLFFPSAFTAAVSYIIGRVVGCIVPLRHVVPSSKTGKLSFLQALSRYPKFPRFALPTGLLNTLIIVMPTSYIAGVFDLGVAGIFFIVWRVLYSPAQLLGRSIGQVFYGEAAAQKNLQNIRNGIIQAIIRTTLVGISVACICLLISSTEVPSFVAEQWAPGWILVAPIGVIAGAQLAVSPLRNVLTRLGLQEQLLMLQVFRFLICGGSFLLTYWISADVQLTLWLYSIAVVISNVVLVLGSFKSLYSHNAKHSIEQ